VYGVPSRYGPCFLMYAVVLHASYEVVIWWCDIVAN